jgi:thiamine pyrophosphokinase
VSVSASLFPSLLKDGTDDQLSSFEGLVSTSNHLDLGEEVVWIKTSKPIWWTAELKNMT